MDKQTAEDRYRIQSNHRWTTSDEIKFLDGLGTWRVRPGNREKLVRNYKASMKHRNNWDQILWGQLIDYLNGVERSNSNG